MASHFSAFSAEVSNQLKYYVYRLIDPRNGETFYIGKGTSNRVFAHVKGEIDVDEDSLDEKLQRIRQIRVDGFEVAHVIHRHGMDEKTAYEVEAALIDAYPEVTNIVGGHNSDDRGLMHSRQIIEKFEAKEAVFYHDALLININHSAKEKDSIYEAVRYAWKVDPKKARNAELILAAQKGLIIGVFLADEWLEATPANFPGTEHWEGRWGFIGHEAPKDIANDYLRHRVPDSIRKRGAANPIRYIKKQKNG